MPHTREDAQNMAEYCPPRVPPTIDIHCHVIPEEFWDASDGGNSWFGASLVHRDEYCYIDTDARFAGPVEANWRLSVDDRVSLMDSIGLDVQIVSPPPYFFNYHLPAEEGKHSARIINEGLLKMIFQKPDRFSAFATLPFQNVDYAVQELEWAMASGMKDVLSHDLENGFDPLKRIDIPTHHDRKARLTSSNIASGYGRINRRNALGLCRLVDGYGQVRA